MNNTRQISFSLCFSDILAVRSPDIQEAMSSWWRPFLKVPKFAENVNNWIWIIRLSVCPRVYLLYILIV